MSNIKKRLNLLRKKKISRNTAGISGNLSDSECSDKSSKDQISDPDSIKRLTKIEQLQQLINGVKIRSTVKSNNEPETIEGGKGLLSDTIMEGPGQAIEDLIPGDYLETSHGLCFRVKTTYPYHHYQGNIAISELLDKNPAVLENVVSDLKDHTPNFSRTLFFDTETTGLDTGAGVYIFLAGLGYFDGNRFVVEQFFMRDFPEEPAVLDALEHIMNRFDTIVTYNGKTYDWPLLESRYAMNRRSVPMNNPVHLDLLHIARKLYKHRLQSCRLVSVEEGVLGYHRLDDLPGALLPERYFQYIRSRDARFIHKAFSHNANDIVSMAALLSSMITLLQNPRKIDTPAEDVYSYARIFELNNDCEKAENAYTHALEKGLNPELYYRALQSLSLIYKRQGQWDKACQLWRTMIQTVPEAGLFPTIELAKYYEHQAHDYLQAKEWVQSAIANYSHYRDRSVIMPELTHRLARIEYKIEGTRRHSEKA